jgi:hypothetical protein
MGLRRQLLVRTAGLVATTFAAFAVAAGPVSASHSLPFNAEISGTLQITGMGPNGPTSAFYSGDGVATHLGATHMEGTISIQGPAACPDGFTATHSDTLTASNGDQVFMAITETSCPRPTDPGTYDCTGTYAVTGGTGRFSSATGSGQWAGSVAFSPTGSATFGTTYSGVLSGPR